MKLEFNKDQLGLLLVAIDMLGNEMMESGEAMFNYFAFVQLKLAKETIVKALEEEK